MANRMIFGTVLTLALTFSPNLVQAVPPKKISGVGEETPPPGQRAICLETYAEDGLFRSPGALEILVPIKINPRQDGRFLPEPLSPKNLAALLHYLTSQFTNVPPLPAPAPNRVEPPKLSDRIITRAYGYLATPYRRGGSLQTGQATDCSGFVQYIYQKSRIDLPRASSEQARVGKVATRTMDFSKLMAGDLLFFRRGGRHIGHVGIYLGNGKMIHAADQRHGVTVTNLRKPYYQSTFVVAKRVLEAQHPTGSLTGRSSGPVIN